MAIAGFWLLPQTASADTSASITLNVSPSSIPDDGTTPATASVNVIDTSNLPDQGDVVTFMSSGTAVSFSPASCTTDANGNCSVGITGTSVGSSTITAGDGTVSSNSAGLTETVGPATNVKLTPLQATIPADGATAATFTATVTDHAGDLLSGETVHFTPSGTPVTFDSKSCMTSSGTCQVSITGTSAGSTVIQANDGGLLSNPATLTETSLPPTAVTLAPLNPSTILGNGSSTTAATAGVTNALGGPVAGQVVAFTTSGWPVSPPSATCTTATNGTCSVTFTSSLVASAQTTTVTATVTTKGVKVSSNAETLTQSATPSSTSLVASATSVITNQPVTFFAVVSSAGSIAGTVTFENRGAPIAGCTGEAVSSATSTSAGCATSFAAGGSPAQVTAVFTPGPGSIAPGSTSGTLSIPVGQDSSSVSVQVPATAIQDQGVTYTANVAAGRAGPYAPTGTVAFLDNGRPITSCAAQPLVNSTATCTLVYRQRGGHSISARYGGDANFTGSSSSAAQITVQRYILGTIKSTMRWTFYYTPSYTKVIQLLVNKPSVGDSLIVKCAGRGCPFRQRVSDVTKSKRCGKGKKRKCQDPVVANLTSTLAGHRLSVGTKLVVVISRTRWIARYYAFTVRARRGPRVVVSCLAPGHSKPGVGCSM
jgi:large repetitive protein